MLAMRQGKETRTHDQWRTTEPALAQLRGVLNHPRSARPVRLLDLGANTFESKEFRREEDRGSGVEVPVPLLSPQVPLPRVARRSRGCLPAVQNGVCLSRGGRSRVLIHACPTMFGSRS